MTIELTEQAIFDQVATHLLRQNERAVDSKSLDCMYRTPDGLKCAVGCLITDEEYRPDMEGKTILLLCELGWLHQRFLDHINFLCDLQRVHDCYLPNQWREDLRDIAEVYE